MSRISDVMTTTTTMAMMMVIQLCVLLLVKPIFTRPELFSPNIAGSEVYVNSLAPGSQPQYAIDDDFVHPQPTCLKTNPLEPDMDGSHWVLIDFGLVLRSIKEIRLAPDPENKIFATKLSNIDAYIVRSGQYFNMANGQGQNPKIPWTSNTFQLCSNSGNVMAGTRVASIECPEPLNGRWLALRKRDGDLNMCLVSVYIQDAFHECFEQQPIDPTGQTRFVGQVFQFMRHVTLSVCRSACSNSKSCQAIMFKRRGRSGICELIDEFHIIESPLQDGKVGVQSDKLKKVEIACNTDNCSIEVNHCHLGTLEQLHKSDSVTEDENVNQENFVTEQIFQDWELDPVKHMSQNALDLQSRFLLSVHVEGTMDCRSSNCGFLNVYSFDLNDEVDLCGSIDSRLVRRLDKHYVFCRSDPPIVGTQKIRLAWSNLGLNELQVNISGVQLRTTFDEITFLRRVNKNLVKINPDPEDDETVAEEDDQIPDSKPRRDEAADRFAEPTEILDTLNFTSELDPSRNIVFHPREVSDDNDDDDDDDAGEMTRALVGRTTTTETVKVTVNAHSATNMPDNKGLQPDTPSIKDHKPVEEPNMYNNVFQTNSTSPYHHSRGDTMRKRDPSSMGNSFESASMDYRPKSRSEAYVEQRDEPQHGPAPLSGASKTLNHRQYGYHDQKNSNSGIEPNIFLAKSMILVLLTVLILEF